MREEILKYRAKYNLSQAEFAKIARLSTVTINSIENDIQTPSNFTRAKIERAFELLDSRKN